MRPGEDTPRNAGWAEPLRPFLVALALLAVVGVSLAALGGERGTEAPESPATTIDEEDLPCLNTTNPTAEYDLLGCDL
jgi:hypothetical protein